MSNLQPNCCLEFDFRKVDQHAGGKWLITEDGKMAYGGQYLLFNVCITQIELKLIEKHTIQIHQWHVGVIGFTNVHLCISFQCT